MALDARGIPEELPASSRAYAGFQGRISRTMAGSQPWWPPRGQAAEGAPNVVVILCDDMGYSDIGCFGSEIVTPNIDRLAAEGVRYTNFHVTPMCSPTRAALLTGRNSHAAGIGYVAHADPGFPGLAMELADDVTTVAEVLRDNGYATFMVGKWHLCKDADITDTGSRKSWPLQRGFDRFYGIMDGMTDMFHPHALYCDNTRITPDAFPEDYYFTDDITDRAIGMVRSAKASDPAKPFFLYFAHGAVHAPLNAPAEDIERHRGAYEQGWDRIREERLERQQRLGIVAPGTVLAPRNSEPGDDVPAWDELTDDQKKVFARYMEVYAAMVQTVDTSLGRLRETLEELGEWDNTFVLFTSDNGASREGESQGTSQYFDVLRHYHGGGDLDGAFDRDLAAFDQIGGPRSLPHYPRGWAMASNTPFRLYKINTHAGGHTVPAVVSWPRGLTGVAGQIRRQYVHATDLYPTILEITKADDADHRHGVPLKPLAGHSFLGSLTDAEAPETHREQYFEMVGHRGYYRDGWEIVTRHAPRTRFDDGEWQLYDLRTDPTQTRDLAADHPKIVADLAARWERAAWENQVFPLNEGSGLLRTQRPEREDAYARPVRLVPGTPTLERYRSLMLVYRRSFRVLVELDFAPGDRGVLFAHGCKSGGYSMSVDDDRLTYFHNHSGEMSELACGALKPGPRQIVLEATALRGGLHVDVRVEVDGEERGRLDGLPMPMGQAMFQGIDIGIDRGSPVSWRRFDAEGTFPYVGTLHAVTWTPGEHAPGAGPETLAKLREIGTTFE
ncbi:arylsulfatase [Sphaerimonospora cavernae]|uniref:Arylsulfatase n=1 Tax=Sphaerimonospora cavernae TaxID=1740611 RepID=A0ABV6UDH1_9ACTN